MTRKISTKKVDKGLYDNYLKKAAENIEAAERSLKGRQYNASAVSAIHAVISAADAYCVFGLGERCSSDNHDDAAALIIDTAFPQSTSDHIAKNFKSVIRIKNMAEYEERLVREKEAEKAVADAGAMIEAVKKALETGK